MRQLCRASLVIAAAVSTATLVSGQPPRKKAGPQQRLRREFAKAPAVGSKLPDVAAYDASGKPFRLGRLKGSYTVLVFGCLT
jgi:cytochrome oxidase Cu insertion factor (SCO1/SenC/PrrC family)